MFKINDFNFNTTPGIIFGNGVSFSSCDFAVFHHLDLSKKLDETLIVNFPRLEKFLYDISGIDSVANYLNNRPELIDVSIEPKLIINGTPHPTGVKET